MPVLARLIAIATLALTTACSPPLSSAPGAEDAIAAGLGAPQAALAPGLYVISGLQLPDEPYMTYEAMRTAMDAEPDSLPLPLPYWNTLDWHEASKTHVLLGTTFQAFAAAPDTNTDTNAAPDTDAAEVSILALRTDDDTYYLTLELGPEDSASIWVHACVDIPKPIRDTHGIGPDCVVETAGAVRDGLAALDRADLVRLDIRYVSALPLRAP